MFKFFGVSDDKKDTDLSDDTDIKLDEDIGQIALDVLEMDNEFIILAPIAGVELGDIDLLVDKSVLTIKGYREKPEIYSDDAIVQNSECFWGKFTRNIILPNSLDFDTIKASLENNLLIIIIKKIEFESQSVKIDRIEG